MTHTTPITELSSSWQSWLQSNLARGCTAQSLIDSMVNSHFDPAFAATCVQQVARTLATTATAAPAVNAAAPEPYRYERPRLQPEGHAIRTSDRLVPVALRLKAPVVAVVTDLFSSEECDELIRLSRIKLQRSTIVDPLTGQTQVITARSSSGTFFMLNENPFIARLDRRIAEVMNWPVGNGEGLQILNYQIGGEYKAHFDYFAPADPGSQMHLAHGGQRVSTLVMYLNDVEAGGETVFPDIGLSVVPKKGSAVYFEYCNSLGQVDPLSLHAGMPVIQGEKWIATKWMRQQRYV